jgi:hypothetical protein
MVATAFFVAIVVFGFVGTLPCVILHDSAWIRNHIKTKIHALLQHGKIL